MKRRTRSLSIHIAVLVLALWFLAMGLLTWAVAQDFQNQIFNSAQYMTGVWSKMPFGMDIPEDTPGFGSLQQIMHLGDPYRWLRAEPLLPIVLPQTPDGYGSDDWFWGKWELLYGFQAATVFYDEAGAPLNKLTPEESRRHNISFGYSNDCALVADEGRIAQVVTNLISNALKYTPEGGNILLQVFAHEGSAHFRITNTADHLPEDVLEKLFDSFYRVDASRSDF